MALKLQKTNELAKGSDAESKLIVRCKELLDVPLEADLFEALKAQQLKLLRYKCVACLKDSVCIANVPQTNMFRPRVVKLESVQSRRRTWLREVCVAK